MKKSIFTIKGTIETKLQQRLKPLLEDLMRENSQQGLFTSSPMGAHVVRSSKMRIVNESLVNITNEEIKDEDLTQQEHDDLILWLKDIEFIYRTKWINGEF